MRKVKMILPAVAFLLAIVASLANGTTPFANFDGYAQNENCGSILANCAEGGSTQCTASGSGTPLYKNIAGVCTTVLNGTRNP